ncbi:MAG TPA: HAD family hydrolase [Thermaerobacter sp.]
MFIDDGGVISDNRVRAAQWQRLVGEFLAPVLGGTPEQWAEANREVVPPLWQDESLRHLWHRAGGDYATWLTLYRLAWLDAMCRYVGVATPPREKAVELALRATEFVTHRVRAAFPGAVEAVRELHRRGFVLYTASGETSEELKGYMSALGIRTAFRRLYGPDLVGVLKMGTEYYRRIFCDAGVRPADAIVVDDRPEAVAWAAEAGARTVLVGRDPVEGCQADVVIASLAGLPGLLKRQALL